MKIVYLCCTVLCLSCTSIDKEMDQALNSDLVRKAGIGNTTAKSVSNASSASSSLLSSVKLIMSDIPYEDERRYGENVGLAMYATPGFGEPIMNQELGLYMNILTNIIGRESHRPGIIYHTAVVHSNEKNVYAVPGGFIFITSGLILALDSEAELAFALAHAVAAIAKKQALNAIKKSQSLRILYQASKELANLHDVPDKDFHKAVLEHKQMILTPEILLQQEADMLGVRYITDVGYDPRVAPQVLDKISISDAQKKKRHESLQYALSTEYDLDGLVVRTGRLQKMKNIIRTATK
ncbi:M48 family metalloprotease [Candidatus Uabimicrobium amorphum]|uniref:Peptidase M48 n=1 Tax=Uabimicrobium amorphum TaxID=2596890 RepID=A0A5S9IJ40_UABAM|nr:M48 family metalloprotease [Candidatus Uabimicrobium amorphum]BBM82396.1 peptidase M48 [Candidatus Uabimicrobium amorphum]